MPANQTQLEYPVRKSRQPRRTKEREKSENAGPLSSPRKAKLLPAIVAKNEITPIKRKPQTKVIEEQSPTKLRKSLPLSPRKNFGNSSAENVPDITKPRRRLLNENSPVSSLKSHNSISTKSPVKQPSQTPKLKSPTADPFNAAKQALHTQQPTQLLCRDTEISAISHFLDTNFSKTRGDKSNLEHTGEDDSEYNSGSLYISGAPGTGKTAVIKHLLSNHCQACKVKQIFVNSMTIKSPYSMYKYIASHILSESQLRKIKNQNTIQKHLQQSITSKGDKILLVLDEMDQLDTKNQDVLYTLFEWPSLPNSRIVLIGIANALDLTDRILPRLNSKTCKPQLLNFTPYTKHQIVTVLQSRLKQASEAADSPAVLDNAAVTFCARKISAVAGDMRKALDICRRSIEVAELDSKKSQILQNRGRKSSLIQPVASTTQPNRHITTTPKTVSLIQVAGVVDQVYGGVKLSTQSNTFPLQQKLVVCSLLLLLKSSKFKDVPLNKALSAYSTICKKRDVQPCDQSEFSSLCSLLEARGIISIKKGKEARPSKLSLKMDNKELEFALQDKLLITAVLEAGL